MYEILQEYVLFATLALLIYFRCALFIILQQQL